MSLPESMLARVWAYVLLQRVVGADRLRDQCISRLDLRPGETVLDVGCGPAYYLGRLPRSVDYYGFDTEPNYVRWAQKRWADRNASFRLGTFNEVEAAKLAPVDAVLLLGVLHHLSDEESTSLLKLTARSLAPTGRVVTVDTCFEPSQGRLSRWMAENDRGGFVREPAAFVDLARTHFHNVEGELLTRVTRIPGSYWMMAMSEPQTSTPLVHER